MNRTITTFAIAVCVFLPDAAVGEQGAVKVEVEGAGDEAGLERNDGVVNGTGMDGGDGESANATPEESDSMGGTIEVSSMPRDQETTSSSEAPSAWLKLSGRVAGSVRVSRKADGVVVADTRKGGEDLCKWRVVEGRVEKASTWHEKERAIGLVGERAVIARETALGEIYNMSWVEEAECLRFTTLANAEEGVSMFLEIVEPGGDIEAPAASFRLRTDNWAKTVKEYAIPAGADRIDIVIRKQGKGEGALAFFGANAEYYCVGAQEEAVGGDL